ncbi:MAG TPA: chalcone isomerase family protein [Vicinamibacteria bacterium]|nr:chalcone isomerase family protein [Vicinamibacteria bacterium]
MTRTAALLLTLAVAAPALAQEVAEPKSGVKFAAKSGDLSLLGVGLRTKTMLKVKVYAVGLYVADSALAGPLAAYKGKTDSPAFYKELVWGDFGKQIVMKFTRDVTSDQIRGAFRETLQGASKLDLFVGYFSDTKEGQEYVITWKPGGILETKVAGLNKPEINDKAFAAAVFGIWLGDRAIQDDIKKGLVSRAGELVK